MQALFFLVLLLAASTAGAQTSAPIAPTAEALAAAMRTRPIVLLGEVHDSGIQHALRAEALRRIVADGARPAIAFEQFDRERQADIERARRERPRDVDYLIEQAGGAKSWRWEFYRPFVQLALGHDLPIVAANLSRKDAFRLTQEGWSVAFDSATVTALGLDRLPADFLAEHQRAVARGHCDLLPADALPAMARAQIARDLSLAQAIGPYLDRGVVLLTGNGHVRRDIAVPFWLPAPQRARAISIGLLERGASDATDDDLRRYDVVMLTDAVERPDPCKELAARFKPATR